MFSITGLMVEGDTPGMVIPVFKMESSNLPFVQQTNEFYLVTDMLPFVASEHYSFSADFNTEERVSLNEPGLLAFRSFDGRFEVMRLKDLFEFRDKFRAKLLDYPLLNLQIARACGAQRGELHQLWGAVAAEMLPEDNRAIWVDSEHRLHQREAQIWRLIEDGAKDDASFDEIVGDASFERLFRWLNKNKLSAAWGKIWIRAFLKRPFDERMLWLGWGWIETRLADLSPVREIKPVLFLLLESTAQGDISEEIGILIREYILSKSDEFYDFYFPFGFLFHLLRHCNFKDREISGLDGNLHSRDASEVSFIHFLRDRTAPVDRLREEMESALRVVLYGDITLSRPRAD